MNADAFRHFYEYHFAENRKLWEYVSQLADEQLKQSLGYSKGSVLEQVLHLINVDDGWFSALRGVDDIEPLTPAECTSRQVIRERWDTVEQRVRAYLADLRDDQLFSNPFDDGEDKNLILWQVLLHVANHATDHRAQILRQLNDFGVQTKYQDYIFFVYEHP